MNISELKPSGNCFDNPEEYQRILWGAVDVWKQDSSGELHSCRDKFGNKLSLLAPGFIPLRYKRRKLSSMYVVIDSARVITGVIAFYGAPRLGGYAYQYNLKENTEKDVTKFYK